MSPHSIFRRILLLLGILSFSAFGAVSTDTLIFEFYAINPASPSHYVTGTLTVTAPNLQTLSAGHDHVFATGTWSGPNFLINRVSLIPHTIDDPRIQISHLDIWVQDPTPGNPDFIRLPITGNQGPVQFGLYSVNQVGGIATYNLINNKCLDAQSAGSICYTDIKWSPMRGAFLRTYSPASDEVPFLSTDSLSSHLGAVVRFTANDSSKYAQEGTLIQSNPSIYDPIGIENNLVDVITATVVSGNQYQITYKKFGTVYSATTTSILAKIGLPQPAQSQADVMDKGPGTVVTTVTTSDVSGAWSPTDSYSTQAANRQMTGGNTIVQNPDASYTEQIDRAHAREDTESFIQGQRMDTPLNAAAAVSNGTTQTQAVTKNGQIVDLQAGLTANNSAGLNAYAQADLTSATATAGVVATTTTTGSVLSERDSVGRIGLHPETTEADKNVAGNQTVLNQARPSATTLNGDNTITREVIVKKGGALDIDEDTMTRVLTTAFDQEGLYRQSGMSRGSFTSVEDATKYTKLKVAQNLEGAYLSDQSYTSASYPYLMCDSVGPTSVEDIAFHGNPIPGDLNPINNRPASNPEYFRPSVASAGAPFLDLDGDGDLDRFNTDDPFPQEFDKIRLLWRYGNPFLMYEAKWFNLVGRKRTGDRDIETQSTFALIGYGPADSNNIREATPLLCANDPITYFKNKKRVGFLSWRYQWIYDSALTDFVDLYPPRGANQPRRMRFSLRFAGANSDLVNASLQGPPPPSNAGNGYRLINDSTIPFPNTLTFEDSGVVYNSTDMVDVIIGAQQAAADLVSINATNLGLGQTIQGTLAKNDIPNSIYNKYAIPGTLVSVAKYDLSNNLLGIWGYPGSPATIPILGTSDYLPPGTAQITTSTNIWKIEVYDPLGWQRITKNGNGQTISSEGVIGFSPSGASTSPSPVTPGVSFTQTLPIEVYRIAKLNGVQQGAGSDIAFNGVTYPGTGLYRWPASFDPYQAPSIPEVIPATPNTWTFDYPSSAPTLFGGSGFGPFPDFGDLSLMTLSDYLTKLNQAGINGSNFNPNRLSFAWSRESHMAEQDPYILCKLNTQPVKAIYAIEFAGKEPRVTPTFASFTQPGDTLAEFFLKQSDETGIYRRYTPSGNEASHYANSNRTEGSLANNGDTYFGMDEGVGTYVFQGVQRKYSSVYQQKILLEEMWAYYTKHFPSLAIPQYVRNDLPLSNHQYDSKGNIIHVGNVWLSELRYLSSLNPSGKILTEDPNADRQATSDFAAGPLSTTMAGFFAINSSAASSTSEEQAATRRQQMLGNPVYLFSAQRGREWELDLARQMPAQIRLCCIGYESLEDFDVPLTAGWKSRFPTIPPYMYAEDSAAGLVHIKSPRSVLREAGRADCEFTRTDRKLLNNPDGSKSYMLQSDEIPKVATIANIFFNEQLGSGYSIRMLDGNMSITDGATSNTVPTNATSQDPGRSLGTNVNNRGLPTGVSAGSNTSSVSSEARQSADISAGRYPFATVDEEGRPVAQATQAWQLADEQVAPLDSQASLSSAHIVFRHPMLVYYVETQSHVDSRTHDSLGNLTGQPTANSAAFSAVYVRYGLECDPKLFSQENWIKHIPKSKLSADQTESVKRGLTPEEQQRVDFEEAVWAPRKDGTVKPSDTNPVLAKWFNQMNLFSYQVEKFSQSITDARIATKTKPPLKPSPLSEALTEPLAPVPTDPPSDTVAPEDQHNVAVARATAVPAIRPTTPTSSTGPSIFPWVYNGVTYYTAPPNPGVEPVAYAPPGPQPAYDPPASPGVEPLVLSSPSPPSVTAAPPQPGVAPVPPASVPAPGAQPVYNPPNAPGQEPTKLNQPPLPVYPPQPAQPGNEPAQPAAVNNPGAAPAYNPPVDPGPEPTVLPYPGAPTYPPQPPDPGAQPQMPGAVPPPVIEPQPPIANGPAPVPPWTINNSNPYNNDLNTSVSPFNENDETQPISVLEARITEYLGLQTALKSIPLTYSFVGTLPYNQNLTYTYHQKMVNNVSGSQTLTSGKSTTRVSYDTTSNVLFDAPNTVNPFAGVITVTSKRIELLWGPYNNSWRPNSMNLYVANFSGTPVTSQFIYIWHTGSANESTNLLIDRNGSSILRVWGSWTFNYGSYIQVGQRDPSVPQSGINPGWFRILVTPGSTYRIQVQAAGGSAGSSNAAHDVRIDDGSFYYGNLTSQYQANWAVWQAAKNAYNAALFTYSTQHNAWVQSVVDYNNYLVSVNQYQVALANWNTATANLTAWQQTVDTINANYQNLVAAYTDSVNAHNVWAGKVASRNQYDAQYNAALASYNSLLAAYNTYINDFAQWQVSHAGWATAITAMQQWQATVSSMDTQYQTELASYSSSVAVWNSWNAVNVPYQNYISNYNNALNSWNSATSAYDNYIAQTNQFQTDYASWQLAVANYAAWQNQYGTDYANYLAAQQSFSVSLAGWQDWNQRKQAYDQYQVSYQNQVTQWQAQSTAYANYGITHSVWQANQTVWMAFQGYVLGQSQGGQGGSATAQAVDIAKAEAAHWDRVTARFAGWKLAEEKKEENYRKAQMDYYQEQGDQGNFVTSALQYTALQLQSDIAHGNMPKVRAPVYDPTKTRIALQAKYDSDLLVWQTWQDARAEEDKILAYAKDFALLRSSWCASVEKEIARPLVDWSGNSYQVINGTPVNLLDTTGNNVSGLLGIMPTEWLVLHGYMNVNSSNTADLSAQVLQADAISTDSVQIQSWFTLNNRQGAQDGEQQRPTGYTGPAPRVRRLPIWQAYSYWIQNS